MNVLLLLILFAAAVPPAMLRTAPASGAAGAGVVPVPGDLGIDPSVAEPIDPSAPPGLLDRKVATPQPYS